MSLSHADIQGILKVLDDTSYDELTLETENFTLVLKRSDGEWIQDTSTGARSKEQGARVASIEVDEKINEPAPSEEGLVDIRAPIVGTFYRAPKPGAEPFVEIGAGVNDNSVIAIIEVMKLMNSIPAGCNGTIVEIHAGDARFVEKGQLLMRVKPSA